jgi:hypothetical protein
MIGLVKFSSMAKNKNKNLGSAYTLMNIADDDKKKSDGFIPKLVSGKLAAFFQLVNQVKPLFPTEFPFN